MLQLFLSGPGSKVPLTPEDWEESCLLTDKPAPSSFLLAELILKLCLQISKNILTFRFIYFKNFFKPLIS